MDELLSIGRFARLCGLSIVTLRHYHEVGVLEPAEVDPETGFRRYERSQLGRTRAIARLRDLGLSLAETAAVLAASPDEQRAALTRHRARTEARIWRLQRVHHRLQRLIDGEESLMASTEDTPGLDPDLERQVAARLFNHAWTLLEIEERTAEQDDELIHTAHASRYHWGNTGRPENLARGEWQCSRVYAVLGRSEPALWHARRSLALCEEHGLRDFDLAYAYEALARGHRVAGDDAETARFVEFSREAGKAIAEEDDRELLATDLATIS